MRNVHTSTARFLFICVGLIPSVLMGGIWMRSYWRKDFVYGMHRGRTCILVSYPGRLYCYRSEVYWAADDPFFHYAEPVTSRLRDADPYTFFGVKPNRFVGAEWSHHPEGAVIEVDHEPRLLGDPALDLTVIVIPYWLPTAVSLLPPVLLVLRHLRQRRRRRLGLCPGCGYDLRASIDRCPECGTARI